MSITAAVFPKNPYHGQEFLIQGNGATYYYDKTRYSWISKTLSSVTESESSGVAISEQPPFPAEEGDIWIQLPSYFMYVFDGSLSGDTGRWVCVTNNGGDNTLVHVGPQPPEGANQKHTFWFDSNSGDLRILYADSGNTAGSNGLSAPASTQWVTITSNGQSIGTSAYLIAAMEDDISQLQETIRDLQRQINDQDNGYSIALE